MQQRRMILPSLLMVCLVGAVGAKAMAPTITCSYGKPHMPPNSPPRTRRCGWMKGLPRLLPLGSVGRPHTRQVRAHGRAIGGRALAVVPTTRAGPRAPPDPS